jgi:hypothetical protein
MNLLHRAMLHLEEATYHYERASRYLLMYAEENHVGLQRTLYPNGQAEKTDAGSVSEKQLSDGSRPVFDANSRDKIVELELRRTKARAGIPTELRDIL